MNARLVVESALDFLALTGLAEWLRLNVRTG
jgi:hypothetical protein